MFTIFLIDCDTQHFSEIPQRDWESFLHEFLQLFAIKEVYQTKSCTDLNRNFLKSK